jgi:UDP-N-acetyl-D-glucosamine/UDP-N-acetyl-D-galactosamine dehydrogenase
MGLWIARETIKLLLRNGGGRNIAVLGVTFKENVPDFRNTRVANIVRELRAFGADVEISDPFADAHALAAEFGIRLVPHERLRASDAVILAVPHKVYRDCGWGLIRGLLKNGTGLVIDVSACLDRRTIPPGIHLWRL